ncbi:MAG: hypothetical protein ACE5IY_05605 [bacterium]
MLCGNVIVDQNEISVTHYFRSDTRWEFRKYHRFSDQTHLASLGIKLKLEDIYANVDIR